MQEKNMGHICPIGRSGVKADKNDTILEKIRLKSHTFYGFSFNVTMVCLNAYDPICRLNSCYTCNRQQ